jgi:hypothetical protein
MPEKAKPPKKPAATLPEADATPSEQAPKKQAAKPAPKKTVKTANATPPKPIKAGKAPKQDRPRKIKTVSGSFTMPEHEYAQLAEFKKRCLKAGVHVKKGELLRAGILNLSRLSDVELINAVAQVEQLKAVKPAKA